MRDHNDAKTKFDGYENKDILIDIKNDLITPLLQILLKDKSTKRNIIWATDTYSELGIGFKDKDQINRDLLLNHADIIKPRIQKSLETQADRTRKKAEVFTPAWLCNLMNNRCDQEWFGRKDVFNIENENHTWTVIEEPVKFPKRENIQESGFRRQGSFFEHSFLVWIYRQP